jgi:hypothetical protein
LAEKNVIAQSTHPFTTCLLMQKKFAFFCFLFFVFCF